MSMSLNFVAKSPSMQDIISVVSKVAKTNSLVLIHGENGVGKSLIAKQIHLKSDRKDEPFVIVNCISESYQFLTDEIFGIESSLDENQKKGVLELASKGTIFFDEISELPFSIQKKLLDKIKNNQVDARIIASTCADLESMVQNETFLRELYYRLSVFSLHIPSLRHRKEDIKPLAMMFCDVFSKKTKKKFTGFTQNALEMLYDYYWSGNVRELKNAVERACILGQPPLIQSFDFHLAVTNSKEVYNCQYVESETDKTLKTALHKFKKNFVMQILESVSWNQTEAAKIMGIQRTYLSKLMSDLDIRK